MDSGCHKLSENIWFVWSGRSYSGEKVGCHACPRTDGRRNVKIGLEFRKQNIIRWGIHAYLIFVIFFTRVKFLENKIYTEKTHKLRENTQ